MLSLLLSCLMGVAMAQLPRGIVMIDVSRHFMPIEFLYRQVDELARYGIPAMQLHLTDAAGWRLEIKAYPQLTDVGAWRTRALWNDWWQGDRRYSDSRHGFGGYYTQDEMCALVTYARERGVDIIPEIEFPAHSEEATAALPWLSCTGEAYTSADLCIGSDSTYVFMSRVLSEVAAIFPSRYLHLVLTCSATSAGRLPPFVVIRRPVGATFVCRPSPTAPADGSSSTKSSSADPISL